MPTDVDDLLRPRDWSEYVGQPAAKAELDVAIEGALERKQMIGHVLLTGRPGFGKTSLASIIASRLGEEFHAISASNLDKAGLVDMFSRYPVGVLLIDEAHAASKPVQDMLLTILEDGWLTLRDGQKIFTTGWLTVVLATTEKRLLAPALRSRCAIAPRIVDYTAGEMEQIVAGMAAKAGVPDPAGDLVPAIARAAGGTPRHARDLVFKARDLQAWRRRHSLPAPTATDVLQLADVDADGISGDHMDYLAAVRRAGGSAGLETLKMLLSLHEADVRELEHFLLSRDLIVYTTAGRELTAGGSRKLHEREAAAA